MFLPAYRGTAPTPSLAAADLGRYFVSTNPTPATGLNTINALATLVDTTPFVSIIAGALPVYLDYVRFTCTNVGTGGASVRFNVKTDNPKTQATGGTSCPGVNTRHGLGTGAALSNIVAGPLTAGAAISARLQSNAQLKAAAPVVGDVFLIKFGGADYGVQSSAGFVYAAAPQVIVDPTMTCQLHLWLPSQSAASAWEFELGFYETT